MTDIIEQAARVTDGLLYGPEALVRPKGRDIAQALADAGLLAQPARTVPTREEIIDVILDTHLFDGGTPIDTADAILALLAGQPTVAEVKAQALEEAADAWHAENTGTSPRAYRWLQHRAQQHRDGE